MMVNRAIFRRAGALLLAALLLVSLCACGNGGRSAQVLSSGWFMRAGSASDGEAQKWYNGFAEAGEETPDGERWYCNSFASSLTSGGRVILTLRDLAGQTKIWLNGKSVGECAGQAGEYALDVTAAARRSGKNTLVVCTSAAAPSLNYTTLAVRGDVMIAATSVKTDAATGEAVFTVTVDNATGKDAALTLEASLTAADTGKVMARLSDDITTPAGQSEHTLSATLGEFIRWSTTNPYLYTAQVRLGEAENETFSVGFKSFTVDDGGFFTLNGEHILLVTADMPAEVMNDEASMRKFVDYVRTCGFNTIRPVSGAATVSLLNYCDSVGMLVENRADGAPDSLADAAACVALSGRNHVSVAAVGLFVSGENAAAEASSEALKAVREKTDAAVFCGAASDKGVKVSAPGSSFFDKSADGYKNVCSSFAIPADYPAEALEGWYGAAVGLDKTFASPVEAYDAAEKAYVAAAEREICALRAASPVAGIDFNGAIAPYPQSMMDVISDSINTLRWCIEADECVYAGEEFDLKVSLSDFGVLWNNTFSALVTVSSTQGRVYEKTVPFTPTAASDGFEQVSAVLEEKLTLDVPTGVYTVAVEFADKAHPVCGERTIYVINRDDLKLSGDVYIYNVSDAVVAALNAAGAGVIEFEDAAIEADATVIASGKLSDAVIKAAEAGARLIVLGANAESGLPLEGEFVSGINYAYFDSSFSAPFASDVIYTSAAAFTGTPDKALVTGLGFASGAPVYGTLIGSYASGSGRICVVTPDLDNSAGSASGAALLIAAVRMASAD